MNEELINQMKMIFELMGSDEFTGSVANFSWNMYQKLIAKGFSEDQAMKIVSGMAKTK